MLPYAIIVYVYIYMFCFVLKTIVIDFDFLTLDKNDNCSYDKITFYDQRYLTDYVWFC